MPGFKSEANCSPAQRTPKELTPLRATSASLESLPGLLELICADRLGDLAIEAGMHTGLLYTVDDVTVEVGAHQPYVVAVVGQREAECRGHDARPQNAYSRHCFSSQKSEQSTTKYRADQTSKSHANPLTFEDKFRKGFGLAQSFILNGARIEIFYHTPIIQAPSILA